MRKKAENERKEGERTEKNRRKGLVELRGKTAAGIER